MKYLLSFPRSGNHLVRFFIELLSEKPTLGVLNSPNDVPIFMNTFPQPIPFNIEQDVCLNHIQESCYVKSHVCPPKENCVDELILILRNPRECLIRQNGFYTWNQNYNWHSYEAYFRLIDYYLNANCKKNIFYYEDILTDKKTFIKQLYDFLEIQNPSKLEYALENADWLFEMSAQGKGRCWEEVKSHGNLNFYYPRVRDKIKPQFDAFLKMMCEKPQYAFIGEKYNIV